MGNVAQGYLGLAQGLGQAIGQGLSAFPQGMYQQQQMGLQARLAQAQAQHEEMQNQQIQQQMGAAQATEIQNKMRGALMNGNTGFAASMMPQYQTATRQQLGAPDLKFPDLPPLKYGEIPGAYARADAPPAVRQGQTAWNPDAGRAIAGMLDRIPDTPMAEGSSMYGQRPDGSFGIKATAPGGRAQQGVEAERIRAGANLRGEAIKIQAEAKRQGIQIDFEAAQKLADRRQQVMLFNAGQAGENYRTGVNAGARTVTTADGVMGYAPQPGGGFAYTNKVGGVPEGAGQIPHTQWGKNSAGQSVMVMIGPGGETLFPTFPDGTPIGQPDTKGGGGLRAALGKKAPTTAPADGRLATTDPEAWRTIGPAIENAFPGQSGSGYRTPEHNADPSVNGAANSYHTRGIAGVGMARDVTPNRTNTRAAIEAWADAHGLAHDYHNRGSGWHVHLQPLPGGYFPAAAGGPPPSAPPSQNDAYMRGALPLGNPPAQAPPSAPRPAAPVAARPPARPAAPRPATPVAAPAARQVYQGTVGPSRAASDPATIDRITEQRLEQVVGPQPVSYPPGAPQWVEWNMNAARARPLIRAGVAHEMQTQQGPPVGP